MGYIESTARVMRIGRAPRFVYMYECINSTGGGQEQEGNGARQSSVESRAPSPPTWAATRNIGRGTRLRNVSGRDGWKRDPAQKRRPREEGMFRTQNNTLSRES